ncbi:Crp/Fnr family transcriptional regulator [Snuella sedimenti]|uniref:Crp/Fnr family transcriptional regulator n=1 Tax=Snuella sedimenti TaxID=2798802 RepID=A0A8J7IHK4_9FLAO|nr:Crp/Fnr family transcriptional regulator [Snuella sedimenti]MBJ6368538.1 Crp/Fnr family transcriptional regulator [Snuella sedimenti]
MEQIREHFETNFNITHQDWQIFASKLICQKFPKKSTILKKGETERYLSFIEKGTIRFYIPNEDKDLTFGFIFKNAFVSAYDSFLTQSPCTYTVEAIEDTVLWRLTYDDLQVIYNTTKIGNVIGRKACEDLFLKKSKRELSLLNETAEVRYLNLFSERPELIKQIPLKYIASYIGVTPQALSRIRKRIS